MGMQTGLTTVGDSKYVTLVTLDGYVWSGSPDAMPPPTPAPLPPNPYPPPTSINVTSMSNQWITPVLLTPALVDLATQYQPYGAVAFVTVDAGVAEREPAAPGALKTTVRHTAVVAYQVSTGEAAAHRDDVYRLLAETTNTWAPVVVSRTWGYVAAAFATRAPSNGKMVVLAFPVGQFAVDRLGAYTSIATDAAGSAFVAVGATDNVEQFSAYKLAQDGLSMPVAWSLPLRVPSPWVVPDATSHVGNPLFTADEDNGKSYVSFSFFDQLVTVDSVVGTVVNNLTNPCGIEPPTVPQANDTPYPMFLYRVPRYDTENATTYITAALINAAYTTKREGDFALCAFDVAGGTNYWKTILPNVRDVIAITGLTPVGPQNVMLADVVDTNGGGIMFGINATTGGYWYKVRLQATGHVPVGVPPTSALFVANMDDDATHTNQFFSIARSADGTILSQCDFACAQTPARSVTEDGVDIFVCSLVAFPQIVRAIHFDPTSNYRCVVIWEQVLASPAVTMSVSIFGQVAITMANGGTATVLVESSAPTPLGPTTAAPPAPKNPGLSGGAVAAIVILVLLGVAVAAGGAYLINRRNVRRSAMGEAQTGMQYTPATAGYGAIS